MRLLSDLKYIIVPLTVVATALGALTYSLIKNQQKNSEDTKKTNTEVVADFDKSSADTTSSIDNVLNPVPEVSDNPLTRIISESSAFAYIGEIRIKKETKKERIAILTDYPQYSISLMNTSNGRSYSYDYALPTFQIKDKRIMLICDEVLGYNRAATYSVEYYEIANGETLSDMKFFESYATRKNILLKEYDVAIPRAIDPNVKGIIKSIKRIDKE